MSFSNICQSHPDEAMALRQFKYDDPTPEVARFLLESFDCIWIPDFSDYSTELSTSARSRELQDHLERIMPAFDFEGYCEF